jgi:hypothetical protein
LSTSTAIWCRLLRLWPLIAHACDLSMQPWWASASRLGHNRATRSVSELKPTKSKPTQPFADRNRCGLCRAWKIRARPSWLRRGEHVRLVHFCSSGNSSQSPCSARSALCYVLMFGRCTLDKGRLGDAISAGWLHGRHHSEARACRCTIGSLPSRASRTLRTSASLPAALARASRQHGKSWTSTAHLPCQ